jgi:hypothetical protein
MVKVAITQTGSGKCALSGYEGEGLTAAFDNDQPLFFDVAILQAATCVAIGSRGQVTTAAAEQADSSSAGGGREVTRSRTDAGPFHGWSLLNHPECSGGRYGPADCKATG